MSLKYKRHAPAPEGQTLLLHHHSVWKDPKKEVPAPPLESEKGAFMPSWTQISVGTALTLAIAAFQHARLAGRW